MMILSLFSESLLAEGIYLVKVFVNYGSGHGHDSSYQKSYLSRVNRGVRSYGYSHYKYGILRGHKGYGYRYGCNHGLRHRYRASYYQNLQHYYEPDHTACGCA